MHLDVTTLKHGVLVIVWNEIGDEFRSNESKESSIIYETPLFSLLFLSLGDHYVSVFWGGLPINCCNIVGVAVRTDSEQSEAERGDHLSHLLLSSAPSDSSIRPVVASSSADAAKVICKGPGLTHGYVGQDIEIQIDAQRAGQGLSQNTRTNIIQSNLYP